MLLYFGGQSLGVPVLEPPIHELSRNRLTRSDLIPVSFEYSVVITRQVGSAGDNVPLPDGRSSSRCLTLVPTRSKRCEREQHSATKLCRVAGRNELRQAKSVAIAIKAVIMGGVDISLRNRALLSHYGISSHEENVIIWGVVDIEINLTIKCDLILDDSARVRQ